MTLAPLRDIVEQAVVGSLMDSHTLLRGSFHGVSMVLLALGLERVSLLLMCSLGDGQVANIWRMLVCHPVAWDGKAEKG